MNLEQIKSTLERAGVVFSAGLSSRELEAAETRFAFVFPPDLREFLSFAMPIGGKFPNWRDLNDEHLAELFDWPLEGLWFDAKQNSLWLSEWGPRPREDDAAYERLRALVHSAPRLIPVQGHRYLPALPRETGNPVLSVYQTDIIYYGINLEDYFANEYSYHFGKRGYELSAQPKKVEFWSSFLDYEHCRGCRLTPQSRGRPQAGFAHSWPPLTSNVRLFNHAAEHSEGFAGRRRR